MTGVRITGRLELKHATVPYAVRFWNCYFDSVPNLYAMRVRQLNFSHCYLPGLDAATIRVDGVLRITGSRIPGVIWLGGARISGAVFLDKAHLGQERTDDREREPVLQLNHATVNDDIWAPGLVTHGHVSLAGATVTGAVNLDNADLNEPDRTVLHADTLTVGSNLSAWQLSPELGRDVVKCITDLAGRRIAYVSCDPATLSRDLSRSSPTTAGSWRRYAPSTASR